jgi:hypothetical protein
MEIKNNEPKDKYCPLDWNSRAMRNNRNKGASYKNYNMRRRKGKVLIAGKEA